MREDSSVAVSIGIPFYNAESTLLDAVRSVFAQTHKDWELILIDDGSTDRSLQIARSIDDPRVRVYSDGQNRRLASRLNEMARLSRFDYMARMDADDLMSPVRIERQMHVLNGGEHIDLVSTGICSLSDDYRPVGLRCVPLGHSIRPRALLAGNSGIVHASLLGRKKWFERNPYNESLVKSEDADLWVRAYSRNDLRVEFLPEPLYYYREDGNVTAKKLLSSYKIARQTICTEATQRFGVIERGRALVASGAKSLIVRALDSVGRMDVIRARRNSNVLADGERKRLAMEVAAIRSVYLPVRNEGGALE